VVIAEASLEKEVGIPVAVPRAVIAQFLSDVAKPAVASDYDLEVAATISYLEQELINRGFDYSTSLLTLAEEEQESSQEAACQRDLSSCLPRKRLPKAPTSSLY
jgi:hypothetical protein